MLFTDINGDTVLVTSRPVEGEIITNRPDLAGCLKKAGAEMSKNPELTGVVMLTREEIIIARIY